jgi:dTDP-4-amino-4,6-dideoxygalactose transaminase
VGACGEVYREAAFIPLRSPNTDCPIGRRLADTSLMFPVHPTLTEEHMHATAYVVERVVTQATRPLGLKSLRAA